MLLALLGWSFFSCLPGRLPGEFEHEKKEDLKTNIDITRNETEFQKHANLDNNYPMGVVNVKEKSSDYQNYSSINPMNAESEEKFNELVVKENGLYHCTVCQKTFGHKTKMITWQNPYLICAL